MKYNPDESYEKWAERVKMFEQGHALQRIAKGEPTDKVLEDMARRMIDKLMHPIITNLERISPETQAEIAKEVERGRISYQKNYIDRISPRADHVVEDKIDKPE